ncbi:hypothetical protein SAMN04487969_102350 [Paenibacillus algorifonticola]|uniref:ABC-2 family transporter protein n=1 Tax=Paenibacillus algorifonticola TaxID=684063 RepID=A0A1I2AB00_9BACL|nr:hypothetical protein [Paenibacillus algorifonticola]SFE40153.1 hypothetical protein SAMN04487969_102350 [Paenibacillus algorifonticola]
MKNDKLAPIELPSELKIEQQINLIVARGLVPKQTFLAYLRLMYARLGYRYVFHDWTEIAFALTSGSLLMLLALFARSSNSLVMKEDIYAAIFIGSPVLYLLVSTLFFVRPKHSDTYETEMVCKYNVYQLASLRMLAFSLICLVLNAALVFAASAMFQQFHLLFALALSASSLFLFSVVFLYIVLRIRSDMMKYVLISVWFASHIGLKALYSTGYMQLLQTIPVSVYLLLTAVCGALYIKSLNQLRKLQNPEGAI